MTWPDVVLLAVAAAVVIRFVRAGGVAMLRMMGGWPAGHDHHEHRPGHQRHGRPGRAGHHDMHAHDDHRMTAHEEDG
jgi:hypothetical protein